MLSGEVRLVLDEVARYLVNQFFVATFLFVSHLKIVHYFEDRFFLWKILSISGFSPCGILLGILIKWVFCRIFVWFIRLFLLLST
jgi:hypothetical protein